MATTVRFKESARVTIQRPGDSPWFQWGPGSWRSLGEAAEHLVTPLLSMPVDDVRSWADKVIKQSAGHLLFVWSKGQSGVGQVVLVSALRSVEDVFHEQEGLPHWAYGLSPARTRWERLRQSVEMWLEDD